MKHVLVLSIFLSGLATAFAQVPSAEEMLSQIDANMSASTLHVTSKMVIHGRRSIRTIELESWIEGKEKAFTEYLSPPREKGTKMLKLGKMLWMYSPSVDRIIQISGHMLKQSVMGSDLSYGHMMEDRKLTIVGGQRTHDPASRRILRQTRHASQAIAPQRDYKNP